MKKKLLLFLAAFIIIASASPQKIYALQKTSASSAILAVPTIATPPQVEKDNRAKNLKAYLETYNSPLAEHAEFIVKTADKYQVDWKLVAAIAGVESSYAQVVPPASYNGWGFGVYGNNVRQFYSWEDGIETVTKALHDDYSDKDGNLNVYQIGWKYAADPLWASKVNHYMDEIDTYKTEDANDSLHISL